MEDDAEAVSRVIIEALRETNAADYAPDIIRRIEESFVPGAVADLIRKRDVFVALTDGCIVGTASLDGGSVRTAFVTPERQRQGIGRRLMAAVEQAARDAGRTSLAVPSSMTAERFYARLGYAPVRDSYFGDERTIIMKRPL